jgi:hypothetical protein
VIDELEFPPPFGANRLDEKLEGSTRKLWCTLLKPEVDRRSYSTLLVVLEPNR